ncbi:YncE family protein [Streptomyces javensis]|uniref:40-residue YVTN family beta-propeller repeat-containing protein n=1 Tax=Streptomyces javensis TaxID=114698 RepID=A0ABP4HMK4_9ACTN
MDVNTPPGVLVINTSTKALTTVGVGENSQHVAVSPDGARAYVSQCNAASVSVIDTGTHTVIDTIGVGTYPMGVGTTAPLGRRRR